VSLNWDVSNIQNHDEVCFFYAPDDDPNHGVSKGDRLLNPVTNSLIWATIAVGIGDLSEVNAAEFFARLRLIERLDGPFLIRAVDPETGRRPEGPGAFITTDEVRAHIGLTTNVSFESRTRWLNRVKHDLDRSVDRYKADAEKATAIA
jgi:hypothetical protein